MEITYISFFLLHIILFLPSLSLPHLFRLERKKEGEINGWGREIRQSKYYVSWPINTHIISPLLK